MRISRVLLTAAFAASTVVATSAPSAAAPTVTLSATSGGPGTRVEVSAPDCTLDGSGDSEGFLIALFVSGTAPNERLAGVGADNEGDGTATIVVPDWLDPGQPATVEAICRTFDFSGDAEDPFSEVDYEPAAFDVEPGVGPSTQTRTFSRTSLLVGQGLSVDAEGCDLPGVDFASLDIFVGADMSVRELDVLALGESFSEQSGERFEAGAVLSNGTFSYGFSEDEDGNVEVEGVEEVATDIAPGIYTAIASCSSDTETLIYEPQLIEVTGSAPVGAIDLTAASGSKDVTLAGSEATGTVEFSLGAYAFEDFGTGIDDDGGLIAADLAGEKPSASAFSPNVSPLGLVAANRVDTSAPGAMPDATERPAATTQALASDDFFNGSVVPDGEGAWSYADSVVFDRGTVEAYAVSGDPYADGFVYDPQVLAIDARTTSRPVLPPGPDDPTNPSSPATPNAARPANAVPGRPDYAG